jgi:hypothetical protein
MTYHQMITHLFAMLTLLNTADSDDNAVEWLQPVDASQRLGAFGDLAAALVQLAGDEIYEHWCSTSEVDLTLANRNG